MNLPIWASVDSSNIACDEASFLCHLYSLPNPTLSPSHLATNVVLHSVAYDEVEHDPQRSLCFRISC